MSQSSNTRIARDEHGKRAVYEDIKVGSDLDELEWVVTPEDIDKQCLIDDDYHAMYVLGGPDGGRIAPPQIQYRPPRWLFSRKYNVRGMFYKWSMENVKPILPGMTITVSGRISDKWIRNDREFVEFYSEGCDEEGDVVFRTTRVHVLDALKRMTAREGEGIDSGIKTEHI
jgi:hypothetical protein